MDKIILGIQELESDNQDGTIIMDEVLNMVNMRKNIQRVKAMHPYEIHYTEKSGYFTNVDDDTQPSGKRKIRRCSEDSLWDALVKWYIDNKRNITLKELYVQWLDWKRTPTNQDNIKRIQASWSAYYLDEPLSKDIIEKPLCKITSLMLREWSENLLKKYYPVDKKKFSRIFLIMNQCFEYASDEDIAIVPENVWQRARKKINKDLITENPLPADEEQVFTDEERKQLKQMIRNDLVRYKKQSSSAGLQILFMLETALRIGECTGLRKEDIRNGRIYIRRQANNEGVKEWTKSTAGYRDIPLTQEAQRILDEVAVFNQEHGYTADWIFQSANPKYDYRLSYNAADRKLRKLCKRLDTVIKSPHKLRKTTISTLLDSNSVSARTVQRFAGHKTIDTTLGFYCYERKSKEEQAKAIDLALTI